MAKLLFPTTAKVGDAVAFYHACLGNNPHLIKWLISLNIFELSKYYDNAFENACVVGNIEIVNILLSLNIKMSDYDAAFFVACEHNHIDIVKLLVLLNVQINNYDNAFVCACENGCVETIIFLISLNNPQIKSYHKAFEAAYFHNLYIAEWLITLGIDYNNISNKIIKDIYKTGNTRILKIIVSNMLDGSDNSNKNIEKNLSFDEAPSDEESLF